MEKSDMMYYLAYILLFILLGIWFLIRSLGFVGWDEMFLLWMLSAGVLMIGFGTVKTKDAPRGSTILIGGGMLLAIIMLLLLAIVTELIGGWIGASIGIILVGIAGLVLLFLRAK